LEKRNILLGIVLFITQIHFSFIALVKMAANENADHNAMMTPETDNDKRNTLNDIEFSLTTIS
jgi:hypothetical protein